MKHLFLGGHGGGGGGGGGGCDACRAGQLTAGIGEGLGPNFDAAAGVFHGHFHCLLRASREAA